jgi:hypothetical protein
MHSLCQQTARPLFLDWSKDVLPDRVSGRRCNLLSYATHMTAPSRTACSRWCPLDLEDKASHLQYPLACIMMQPNVDSTWDPSDHPSSQHAPYTKALPSSTRDCLTCSTPWCSRTFTVPVTQVTTLPHCLHPTTWPYDKVSYLQHPLVCVMVQPHVNGACDVVEQVPHCHHALVVLITQHKGVGGNSTCSPQVGLSASRQRHTRQQLQKVSHTPPASKCLRCLQGMHTAPCKAGTSIVHR